MTTQASCVDAFVAVDPASLDAAWTQVDSATSTNVSWGQGNGALAYIQTVGDNSAGGAGHGLMRALSGVGGSLATGDGFVAAIDFRFHNANYASFGLMLADGVTSGSGNQLWGSLGFDSGVSGGYSFNLVPYTNYSSVGSNASNRLVINPGGRLWLRLAKVGSTSYRLDVSPTGGAWTPAVSPVTNTNAFTHVGFFGTTFSGSGAKYQLHSIDHLDRVQGVS